jgi:hypothetical protein
VHSRSCRTRRPRDGNARSLLVALRRWSVPGDDQHCPGRAAEHTLADGTLLEPLPAAPPVGSEDDQIGFFGRGLQHDRARRIAMLLDGPNRNAFALRTLSQAGQKLEAFALVP